MLIVVAFILAALISTIILAATLYILSSENDNPFDRDEHVASWIRCLAPIVLVKLLVLLPVRGAELIALVGFWAGLVFLFKRSLGAALLVMVSNAVLGALVVTVLNALLPTPWLIPLPLIVIAAIVLWLTLRRRREANDGLTCPDCKYSWRGLGRGSPVCPECGRPIRVPNVRDP